MVPSPGDHPLPLGSPTGHMFCRVRGRGRSNNSGTKTLPMREYWMTQWLRMYFGGPYVLYCTCAVPYIQGQCSRSSSSALKCLIDCRSISRFSLPAGLSLLRLANRRWLAGRPIHRVLRQEACAMFRSDSHSLRRAGWWRDTQRPRQHQHSCLTTVNGCCLATKQDRSKLACREKGCGWLLGDTRRRASSWLEDVDTRSVILIRFVLADEMVVPRSRRARKTAASHGGLLRVRGQYSHLEGLHELWRVAATVCRPWRHLMVASLRG